MTDPRPPEGDYRRLALEALAAGDGRAAHAWAKGWIGSGGGAWIVDPWLVYVASALLGRQPRNAVHSTDVALRHWISDPPDRSILLWVRGAVIRSRLLDPKAALSDFTAAARAAPAWLYDQIATDVERCEAEAARSRKRRPSVTAAPDFEGPGTVGTSVAQRRVPRLVGARPPGWDAIVRFLIEPGDIRER